MLLIPNVTNCKFVAVTRCISC